MDRRRRRTGRPAIHTPNLFTGMVRDADAGRTLSIASRFPNGVKRTFLRVPDVPGVGQIDYASFEECVLATVAQLRPEDVLESPARNGEREQRIAALTARVTALDHHQRQLQAEAADPAKAYVLPVLAHVAADLNAAARELEALKMESLTGRAEALAEAQSLTDIRGRAGAEDAPTWTAASRPPSPPSSRKSGPAASASAPAPRSPTFRYT